jgi:8-amino-7-oxononanoate synthase
VSSNKKGLPGLSASIKDKLIQQALERKLRQAGQETPTRSFFQSSARKNSIPEEFYRFDLHPGYRQLQIMNEGAARMGVRSPFFKLHDGTAGATTQINGQPYVNYASYDYLGMSSDEVVHAAARDAIARYGTSVSASRLVSGERPIANWNKR